MIEVNQSIARRIIETVGANGIPPQYGYQYFSSGLDPYLNIIDDEYLGSFISEGGSAFKMVVGVYGGGKTHFLYSVRDIAWKHNFAVSYVSLSQGESPFHRLELVYKAIVRGIIPPLTPDELDSGYEQGIASFLRTWYSQRSHYFRDRGLAGDQLQEALIAETDQLSGVESISFGRAVKSAFSALLEERDDEFDAICQWLAAEGYDRRVHSRHGILERINRETAFPMLRSLSQWVRQIGFTGLVVLLDEAERVPSLSTKQREQHLGNLREVIDECGHTTFRDVMIFYAVPDESFLEGRTQVYEALKQRVATVFESLNPSGVKIQLEQVVTDPLLFLHDVGRKLSQLFETAYGKNLDEGKCEQTIDVVARNAFEERFGDIGYKRLFVQRMVKGLHFLRATGTPPSSEDLR